MCHTPGTWLQRRACRISLFATPSLGVTVQETVSVPSPGTTCTLAGSGPLLATCCCCCVASDNNTLTVLTLTLP